MWTSTPACATTPNAGLISIFGVATSVSTRFVIRASRTNSTLAPPPTYALTGPSAQRES